MQYLNRYVLAPTTVAIWAVLCSYGHCFAQSHRPKVTVKHELQLDGPALIQFRTAKLSISVDFPAKDSNIEYMISLFVNGRPASPFRALLTAGVVGSAKVTWSICILDPYCHITTCVSATYLGDSSRTEVTVHEADYPVQPTIFSICKTMPACCLLQHKRIVRRHVSEGRK